MRDKAFKTFYFLFAQTLKALLMHFVTMVVNA
jgi:hypothetical protein